MRGYLYCGEAGLVEKQEWLPNSWVNVECPDADDFDFLTKTLGVPESFLDDIADVDERSRTEIEGDWLLTILRIPVQSDVAGIPFTTVPLGVITNNDIIVSICYYHSEKCLGTKQARLNIPPDLFIGCLVPEIPETNQCRCNGS